jgi:hypothetical protein
MQRQSVKSSHVSSVGYEPNDFGAGVLEVEFKGGAVYRYHHVSRAAFDELMAADSIGRHLRQHIVGRHTHVKQ